MKQIIEWIVKLHVVPTGALTLAAGWLGIVSALLCWLGVTIPGMTCPADPWIALQAGLIGVGLGRRK